MMQASCYYSQYRDTEGDRQMLIASRCPKYEDYVKNESLGEQKSLERAYGEPGMPLRIAAWSSITFPYFGEMRDLGQLVVYRAMKSEVAGNVKQGVALRMSVLHCGSLMRSQGPIPICNLVGISLTTIAANRPGGAQPIDSVKTSKAGYFTGASYSSSLALQNELKEKHRARLISYLRIHGFDYEAKIVKHEYQSCYKAQAIIKDGAIQNFFLLVIPPMLTSLVSSLILAVIAFLGVLWIAAVLLSRLTMMKERQRLSPGAASAVLISVPYALFLSLISVEPQEWGLYFTPLLCIAIVCVASYIMKWQTMGCFTKTLAFSTSALTVIFFFATNGVRSYPPVMQFWSIINGLSVG